MSKSPILILTALLTTILTVAGLVYYAAPFGSSIVLTKTNFKQLQDWDKDDHAKAMLAFQQSCKEIIKRQPEAAFGSLNEAGKVQDWQVICKAASKWDKADKASATLFFEKWFQPYQVKVGLSATGLFTGYYLPLLQVSLTSDKKYNVPIYGLPRDLIRINLGSFNPELSGKTIIGQLKNNKLRPYPTRSEIVAGALHKTAPILLWGDNAIDIFFAQIQGSAIGQLPDGKQILIGYEAANGHAYTAIGKVLIDKKLLSREKVTMQSIKAWLDQHPDQMNSILNENASYVFFRLLKSKDAIGAETVPLTTGRSLAIDRRYLPLGAPVWLETSVPAYQADSLMNHYRHLLIAQDTGGNIKGAIRGDVYWGAGEEAAYIAGHMNSKGKYWVLLPRFIQHDREA